MPRRIKIGFASTDWSRSITNEYGPVPGGSNWIRMQQYRDLLKHDSVTGLLVHHPARGFGVLDWFQKTHYDVDLIICQRIMFGKLAEQMMSRPSSSVPILNDVDDWYWGLHEDNHAYRLTHPDNNAEENIDHYKNVIKSGDGVIVSTPFLEERMRVDFSCQNVHLSHNCVRTADFPARHHGPKKPIVGWTGSTSHRSGDLEQLRDLFSRKRYRIHHSGHVDGAAYMADKIGLDRGRVSKSPMHEPRRYAKYSFQFDIGIAPLNDVPFNYAKSWIKGLEYAAAGVPFVASNIGEYSRLHQEYGLGRVASTVDEWFEQIEELYATNVRRTEGKRQRDMVREIFDVKAQASRIEEIIDSYL